MLLPHAIALAAARSTLAALADNAPTAVASSGYERVLLELDRIHGDVVPALNTERLVDGRDPLLATAIVAMEGLVEYGVDALQIEIALEMLDGARELNEP